jgi:hypothetical protein
MRIAPTQSTPDGNRFNQVPAAVPAEIEIVVAFCRNCVTCRNSVMQSLLKLWTLLRNKGFHLAAELQPCRTNRVIDGWQFDSRRRTRRPQRSSQSLRKLRTGRKDSPNDQAC